MSDEDRARFLGLLFAWGREVQRQKAIGEVASMEMLLADATDPASVAEVWASSAEHLRADARRTAGLAAAADEMATILRRAG